MQRTHLLRPFGFARFNQLFLLESCECSCVIAERGLGLIIFMLESCL